MGYWPIMSKKSNDFETLVTEALGNIRDDRDLAREFLNDIGAIIANDASQTKYLSTVAAKHIETLQRSNEQLVKIISLKQKAPEVSFDLNDEERDNIFDLIQGEASNG
jgi:hypothetical protein